MHLIARYWRACAERGDKPRAVYAVIHGANSSQPEGYLQSWSVSKRAALRAADNIAGHTLLVKILPPTSF